MRFIYVLILTYVSLTANTYAANPVPVVVAPVRLDTFIDTLEALGTAQANEAVEISSNVTEVVKKISFTDGMLVKSGQELLTLEDAEERALLQAARVNVEQQQREYNRLRKLVRDKAIPRSQLDTQDSLLKDARAQLQAAQARLRDRHIKAPFSGVLGLRRISLGALVEPGTVITTLDDISIIKLDFSVPETFLAVLHPELEIFAKSDAYPSQKFSGSVKTIDSRVDPVTRAISVRAEIPNPDNQIRAGMLMTVELVKDRRESLMIPEEALIPRSHQQFVYVVDETLAINEVAVKLGKRRPGAVEILEGLEMGQKVVVEGTTRVRPGATVTIQREFTEEELEQQQLTQQRGLWGKG